MNKPNIILLELAENAPALVNLPKRMPFTLPAGYFDSLALELLAKTHQTAPKPAVPEGYFEALPGTLLSKIKAMEAQSELAEIAPVLDSISRRMPYQLPVGYFENLSAGIPKTTASVISIRPKFMVLRWAIAASVIVLIGLFTWQNFRQSTPASPEVIAASATGSETDTTISLALAGIEDASLSQELNQNGVENEIGNAVYYLHAENIETALRELSDEEIKSQLASTAVEKNKS